MLVGGALLDVDHSGPSTLERQLLQIKPGGAADFSQLMWFCAELGEQLVETRLKKQNELSSTVPHNNETTRGENNSNAAAHVCFRENDHF